MYALMCLYLYCVALTAAAAIQNFWNEDEFCRKLNAIQIANITCNSTQLNIDDINILDNVRILCRELDSLTYVWTTKNKIDGVKIVVELISHDTIETHLISETNLTNIRFDSLKPNTKYASRFRKLINGTTYHAAETQVHKTLDVGQNKGLVHTINISNFTVTNDSTLNTSLTWMPSNDMNCRYKIIYHSNYAFEGLVTRYVDVKESYAYTLNALIPARKYTLTIQPYYRLKKSRQPSSPEIR
ncbi:uncharacterized protein LOC100569871 [Acyrthosiphon pisum]|uniref:Fibronectin type-III domain-containing protein n=1 Tax=Acyrthosiphon pisum TaxID=7029 RepID=A0A8R1W5M8_ACYPI|nr:uncharacterized protein LOC100569871 [Acyrthosiphon pisum]|eukprot:XP_003243139.2 PREDICTED: uncharacterized protein LOC100569871 [Acyrthosiphon pisum]